MATVHRTYCSAEIRVDRPGTWPGHPTTCPWMATGPHPDPAVSYRRPLCDRHRAEAVVPMFDAFVAMLGHGVPVCVQ